MGTSSHWIARCSPLLMALEEGVEMLDARGGDEGRDARVSSESPSLVRAGIALRIQQPLTRVEANLVEDDASESSSPTEVLASLSLPELS